MLISSVDARVENALVTTPTHLHVFAFATEAAAMDLRLIEQACGCCTVRGGRALKVRARLCRWHSGGMSPP